MGTADFACPSLAALDDSPLTEVLAVVTQPDRPRGRQLIPHPPAVKVEAQRRNLPVHQPERLRDDFEFLTGLALDLIVVAAYGQFLSQPVLSLPEHGCINVHGSLLPLYRGAAPIQRAILDGHTETGVTIMEMEAGLDTGAMISKVRTPIEPADNAHHVWAGNHTVEIRLAALNSLGQILSTNQVGTRRLGFIGLGVTGKDSYTHGLACAVRHGNHTAHHLVSMARVDTQIHGDFDGLVKF